MCDSTQFTFCTCPKRELKGQQPRWTLYSSKVNTTERHIVVGTISQKLPTDNFNFNEFEEKVLNHLNKNILLDFDYSPQHQDIIHVEIPKLKYSVSFKYTLQNNQVNFWENLNKSFQDKSDFEIKKEIEGKIIFKDAVLNNSLTSKH